MFPKTGFLFLDLPIPSNSRVLGLLGTSHLAEHRRARAAWHTRPGRSAHARPPVTLRAATETCGSSESSLMTHTSRLQCTGRPRYSSPGGHRLSGRDDSSIGQNSFKIGTVTQSFGPSLMGRSWPAESFTIRSARSGLKHTHIRPQGSLRDKIQVLKKPIFSCCTTDKKEHMLLPKIQKP